MFEIATVEIGDGAIGIGPMPGRGGDFFADVDVLQVWRPNLVVTMNPMTELIERGGGKLPEVLALKQVAWLQMPVADFGVPTTEADEMLAEILRILRGDGRVFVHCYGGCGRSGMVVLRSMIALGEAPEVALARLRAVRPCAVETAAQMAWAQGLAG